MICKHCLRTIHEVVSHGVIAYVDETNDPFYCPKALRLEHVPQEVNRAG